MTMEKRNKLIAEFLGYDTSKHWWYNLKEGLPAVKEETCKYNSSWNELMPVIYKINHGCGYVGLNSTETKSYVDLWQKITYGLCNVDINLTYEAVVKYIEWYNNQKLQ